MKLAFLFLMRLSNKCAHIFHIISLPFCKEISIP